MTVNLRAVFQLCQGFAPDMIQRGWGRIINLASLLSFQGGVRVPAYAASKGAVAQLTKALCNEWAASGVNVNAVASGYIETAMNGALTSDCGWPVSSAAQRDTVWAESLSSSLAGSRSAAVTSALPQGAGAAWRHELRAFLQVGDGGVRQRRPENGRRVRLAEEASRLAGTIRRAPSSCLGGVEAAVEQRQHCWVSPSTGVASGLSMLGEHLGRVNDPIPRAALPRSQAGPAQPMARSGASIGNVDRGRYGQGQPMCWYKTAHRLTVEASRPVDQWA